jgi:hypothetical protein
VLAVAAFGFSAASGAADGYYTWPGAVSLHVHTTPADASPGYVQSDPYYIDCPNACDRSYDPGQSVTLWAHPTGGFAFTSWTTGPCAGTTVNPCTFTITADTDVTADFSGHYVPTAPNETNNLFVYPIAALAITPTGSPSASKLANSAKTGLDLSFLGTTTSSDGKINCSTFGAFVLSDYTGCSAEEPDGSSVVLTGNDTQPFCEFFLGWLESDKIGSTETATMNGNYFAVPFFLVNPICVI